MERGDTVGPYKGICADYLRTEGLEVHLDVEISDSIRWRPHLYAKDGSKIIVDILDSETIPALALSKYVEAMNAVPGLQVAVALIGDSKYLPELFSECYQYGIGIIILQNKTAKQILPPRPRQILTLSDEDQIAIMPGKPFGNILGFKRCLRLCNAQLNWLEVNLPKKSFELLYENIQDGDLKVQSIRLLRGIDDKLTPRFHDSFRHFKTELSSNGIKAELRIIMDRTVTETIHGRYIYSKDHQHNELRIHLPPVNSLSGNQWDTIFTGLQMGPPFDSYWESAVDIMTGWNPISRAVSQYLDHKLQQKSGSSP